MEIRFAQSHQVKYEYSHPLELHDKDTISQHKTSFNDFVQKG